MIRKQTQVGRKFIFGAEDGEGQEDTFARKLEGSRNAFDGSSAQRFSGTFGAKTDEGSPTGDRVLILVGGLVFLLVIGLVIFLLSIL